MGRHRLIEADPDEGRVPRAFCVCGHFASDHLDPNPLDDIERYRNLYCVGRIGRERCTCAGYRESWRSWERRTGWAQWRSTGGHW